MDRGGVSPDGRGHGPLTGAGKVGHAEIRIGDTVVMLADVHPDFDAHGPPHYGGSPIRLHMYVEDVDAVARQAIAAGAKVKRTVADQFYGDRLGTFAGPQHPRSFSSTTVTA